MPEIHFLYYDMYMSYLCAIIFSMQISRLFTIVYILMERESVTASELAERFEVSTRTIYRDLDKLAQGGVPLYTNRGKGGGISLSEGFVIDRSLLSLKEKEDILLGLHNLKSLNIPGEEGGVIDEAIHKLGALFKGSERDWIKVDLNPWSDNFTNENLFIELKRAILDEKTVSFIYYGRKGESEVRHVEPYQLQFNSRSWYLYAFCLTRQAFRLFKLTRIDQLETVEKNFAPRPLPSLLTEEYSATPPMVDLLIKIDSSLAWRVYDEFPKTAITNSKKGDFTIRISYPEDEWVYGYLMSFGDKAQVLSPNRVRRVLKKRFSRAVKKYS
jgi:predicted DNA-binding transcriptional regulator YafY